MLLEGKKAVVTGGTRGIGFAVVETFLKNGASVALFGSRQETVDKALAKLKAENPDWDVMGLAPDLTDYAAVEAAMAKVTEAFGRIDILVNNAGISAREPLYQYDPAAFKHHGFERDGRVQRLPRRRADYEGAGRRRDHQHQLDGQHLRPALRRGLSDQQIRRQRPDPQSRARAGARQHPRERGRPRRDPHGHGRQSAGGHGQAHLRADSPPAHGRAAGGRQCVPVPRQRSGQLCHGRNSLGGRRGADLMI